MRLSVTVTLDGRILLISGRFTLELVEAAATAELMGALQEARQLQHAIQGTADDGGTSQRPCNGGYKGN